MQDLDIGVIRNFVAVAELRNISKAAESLYISQPSLSRQIAKLEQTLNQTLLKRDKNGVKLTTAGAEAYSLCNDLLNSYDRFCRELLGEPSNVVGTLRVGSFCLNEELALPIHQHLLQKYQGVKIKNLLLPQHYMNLVGNGKLDAAYICDEEYGCGDQSLKKLQMATLRNKLLVSADNPLAKKDHVHLSELKDERFVLPALENSPGRAKNIFRACKDSNFTPTVVYHANNITDYVMAVAGYNGVAILPYLQDVPMGKNLKYIDLDGFSEEVPVSLIWDEKNTNPVLRHYIEYVSKWTTEFKKV